MTEIVVDPLVDRPEPRRPLSPQPPRPLDDSVPRLAEVLGAIGRGLILTGVIVLLFVVFQLWGTNLQEARAQDGLRDDLNERFDAVAGGLDTSLLARPVLDTAPATDSAADATDAPDDPPAAATTEAAAPAAPIDDDVLAALFPDDGDALARIEIPSLDVDKVVVRGVAVADLRKGPGHYSQTALPGNTGNASIAGHRTTYGAPFNRIDELVPGDEITVTSVQGEFTYRVLDATDAYADDLDQVQAIGDGHIIVDPGATWVLGDFGDNRLTLTACHPKLSSRQRIIVAAELVDDPVELPEWVIAAGAERTAANEDAQQLGADGTTDTMPVDDDPVLSDTSTPTGSGTADGTEPPAAAADAPVPDLDEGLGGERDAIVPAAVWMVVAVAFWYVGGRLGDRFATARPGRLGLRFAGLVPALVCLWFSFELIDRALPAA
ncbi:MAG: sortase [Actinomycetota bacterium]